MEGKTLQRMTEEEAKKAYKFIIENRYQFSRMDMAKKLGLKDGTVWGMMHRLRLAGFDIPRLYRTNVLQNKSFVEELQELDKQVAKTAIES